MARGAHGKGPLRVGRPAARRRHPRRPAGGVVGGRMSRIVIVSNRVPLPSGNAGQAGGLAVALLGLMQRRGGLWFGWSGAVTESAGGGPPGFVQRGPVGYATLDLTEAEHAGYYSGYSNGVLWPMLHSLPHLMAFRRQDLDT